MRLKGGRNHPHPPSPTFFHGPPQNLLVTQVHPIEVPEGDDYPVQRTTSAFPSSPSSLYTASNSSPHITL
jgi:hypothetical protein